MSATQKPEGSDGDSDESVGNVFPPPTPDEDGPHDVPDDTVIEKTLPSSAGSDKDGRGGRP